MYDIFTIRPWHWLTAIAVALLLHAAFILQLNQSSSEAGESEELQSITVTLKKLAVPTTPEVKPEIYVPKQPRKLIKESHTPKPKKKPAINKPAPVIQMPEVQPLRSEDKLSEIHDNVKPLTSTIQSTKPVSNNKPSVIPSKEDANKTSQIRNDYLVKLSIWLAKHKRYPMIARRKKQEDTVKVRFSIDAEGALVRYQILEASKYSSLNNAVEKLLQNASPMPAVPEALRQGKSEFEYTIPIEYKLLSD